MAASTSRQLQEIRVGTGLVAPVQSHKQKKSRKGKGKEQPADQDPCIGESSTQARSRDKSHQVDSAWEWVSLTDPSASQHPPIFTKDGSYFFSVVGGSVKIYSVTTGQVVSTLSTPSSSGKLSAITSATLNPCNAFQLITGSLNGLIMVWDILDGVLLRTIDISQPIHHICAHEEFKDSVFVAVSRPTANKLAKDDNGAVLRVSLTPSPATAHSQVQKSSEVIAIGKTKTATGLALSHSGAWLIAVAGHKAYVAMTSSLKAGFTKYVSPEGLTCLVCHPSEDYFATGDEKGNIRLWYCLNNQLPKPAVGVEKKAQTTTLHWHAHAVSSLAFTPNGAYLLSGGEEAVLVIWQLHTGKKEFIPRLGAPIQTIGVCKTGNDEEYLLGLADATYSFVSASRLKISRSYSRIKLEPMISRHAASVPSVPLALHSMNFTIILPSSHPSSLQSYSPSSAKLVSELEVSPSNRVSRRDDKPSEPSRVEQVAVSPSGEWMATIDYREGDDTFGGEAYLKIWQWKTGNWVLNTRIDRPHGLKRVTAMSFSPEHRSDNGKMQLVTAGHDGLVKTWRIRALRRKDGESEVFWVARSVFGFRSEVPLHASWSPDGSLLAVSFGPFVNVYDGTTNLLRKSLTFPLCKTVTKAYFIGRTGRFLVAHGYKEVFLWDLIVGCVRWRYHCTSVIDDVVPHPLEDFFALLYSPPLPPDDRKTQILVFGVSSSTAQRIRAVPFQFLKVLWYSLPPPLLRTSSFSLVGITASWSVVLVGDEVLSVDAEPSLRGVVAAQSDQKRTLFQDIFGKSAFLGFSKDAPPRSQPPEAHSQPWTGSETSKVFDRPAYLTPSLESLYLPLMDGFLRTRVHQSAEVIDGNTERIQNQDQDMSVDAEGVDILVDSKSWSPRVVTQEEMSYFVDLFKKQTLKIKPPIPVSRSTAKGNGPPKTKVNGTGHPIAPSAKNLTQLNGVPPPENVPPSTNATTGCPSSASVSPPPPSTAEIMKENTNKKRKIMG